MTIPGMLDVRQSRINSTLRRRYLTVLAASLTTSHFRCRCHARAALKAGEDPGLLRKADKAKAGHEAVNTLESVAGD